MYDPLAIAINPESIYMIANTHISSTALHEISMKKDIGTVKTLCIVVNFFDDGSKSV